MIARIASNGEALRYSSPNKLNSMILFKKIWEESNRGFCYFLSKSNVFVVLTTLRFIKTTNALRGLWVAPLFWPSRFKKFTAFSAHKSGLEKIGANYAPKKLLHAIFACPSFANKIISAALKLSAKNGLRPSHESTCDLSANSADKKERAYNSLPCLLTRLLL